MTEQGLKYLFDIIRAIDLIGDFTSSINDFDEYTNDLKTQSAVERQLGIIGEAVNKYDLLFPESSLENAKKIIGFRNRLIHAYDAVDAAMIWVIIKKYLQPLKDEANALLISNS
ncbi:MAG: DUF86 domain-containing protein [Bacteroidales bacterium]|nr:DUF86 domain-containing protein [Bacteroidales bacterium]